MNILPPPHEGVNTPPTASRSSETAHAKARTIAALADDEELMWRMGVREWEIVGGISRGLRAEVIRQSREHVSNLADALIDSAVCECSPAEVERGRCVLCGRPFPAGGSV